MLVTADRRGLKRSVALRGLCSVEHLQDLDLDGTSTCDERSDFAILTPASGQGGVTMELIASSPHPGIHPEAGVLHRPRTPHPIARSQRSLI